MIEFKVGDKVVIAEDNQQNYRSDVKVVSITEIKSTPKRKKYFLSDGGVILSERKMYLIK
jgi:hypothetical protein